jgi:signal peptidase II
MVVFEDHLLITESTAAPSMIDHAKVDADEAEQLTPPRWTYARVGFGLALATLVLDQLHKGWMIKVTKVPLCLQVPCPRLAVTPFLDLMYVINPGISYSLLSNLGQWPLIAFAAVAAIVLGVWIAHAHSRLVAASLGLIAGGAVGNAIDRLHLGGVADFFSFHAGGYYWYVFNIADVAIVAGVAGLLYDSGVVSRKKAGNAA